MYRVECGDVVEVVDIILSYIYFRYIGINNNAQGQSQSIMLETRSPEVPSVLCYTLRIHDRSYE